VLGEAQLTAAAAAAAVLLRTVRVLMIALLHAALCRCGDRHILLLQHTALQHYAVNDVPCNADQLVACRSLTSSMLLAAGG
jgi:hypothetical protein